MRIRGRFAIRRLRLVSAPGLVYIAVDFGRAEDRFRPATAERRRKVRTPPGAMPRNPDFVGDTRGRNAERHFDGECHRKQTAVPGFQILTRTEIQNLKSRNGKGEKAV